MAQLQNASSNSKTCESGAEKMCRYCFCGTEEGNELISPCNCKGFQKWVHLECLRRWQRSIIVSQPTHPAFYARDERQFICNVCKSEFSVVPPTRAEMMASFTGDELANLLQVGCFITATKETSQEMEETISDHYFIPQIRSLAHWIKAVMLVIEVESDSSSVGDDTIIAINLTRQIEDADDLPLLEKAQALSRTGITFRHFIGGPCCQEKAFAVIPVHFTDLAEIEKLKGVQIIGKQGGLWIGSKDIKQIAQLAISEHNQFYDPSTRKTCFVNIYWGDARWSRTQLLGELARGNWGMCRATLKDIFVQPTKCSANLKTNDSSGSSESQTECQESDTKVTTRKRAFGKISSALRSFSNKKSKSSKNNEKKNVHIDSLAKNLWEEIISSGRLIYAKENEMTEEKMQKKKKRSQSIDEEDQEIRDIAKQLKKQRDELRAKMTSRKTNDE